MGRRSSSKCALYCYCQVVPIGRSYVPLSRHRFYLSTFYFFLAICSAYGQTPSITAISPNPLGIGQSVTISGTNFGSSGSVTFSGIAATTTSWNSTSIVATVPAGTVNGNVVVTSGSQHSAGFAFTVNNGPVNYFYDDLGRLVGVIDVNGNAAEYSYDAVGNITAIARFTSSQASVINFTPDTGPVGTAVTINGTGFSSTASQDTVKFNGVSATVSSATNTQLQVTVPASATTGPISVSCPNGSATSTESFTVTSSNGVPTIISFTPTSGLTGAAVTLTGTNFNPTLANDELRMNSTPAVVSTVSPTTIATTVPTATSSGRFTLVTPAGTAVSSSDFYVPLTGFAVSAIDFTARVTPGQSLPVTVGSNQIGLVLFDGTLGQHVTATITNSTFASCELAFIEPSGPGATDWGSCSNGAFGPELLSQNGTYSLGIVPQANTGGGSLTLVLTLDFVGTIAINGPPVTATTTEPGQDARLMFEATGQRVVVYATNVTNQYALVSILGPNQIDLGPYMQITNSPAGQTFFLDTQSLGYGTYQLWIPHNSIAGGSETLQIVSVPPDFSGTLVVPAPGTTGPATSTGNLVVGQNANLTFSGIAGQQLSFNVTNSTIGSCVITIYDPNTNTVGSGNCGTGNNYVDTITLGLTGTYTVNLNPQGTATGSVAVSINNAQNVTTPAISIGGSAVTETTTVPGQNVLLSFTPTSSQNQIAVTATNVSNPFAYLNLLNPSGGTQTYTYLESGNTAFIGTQSVTPGQQYQLQVQHSGTGIGSETLQIYNVPATFTGTLTVPAAGVKGTAVRVPTSGSLALGQSANLTFSGTAGQQLSFNVINSTIGSGLGSCVLTVYDPNQNTVGSGYCGVGASYLDTITLALTGTYTVNLSPQGTATGSVSISINNAQTVTTPSITVGGSAVTAKTTVAGQDVRLSFTPSSSQTQIAILATTVTNPFAYLNLVNPSGSTQTYTQIDNSPSGQTFYIDTQPVTPSEEYQLWVQHYQTDDGNETLQIKNVPANISHTVTINGAAYQFSTVVGQNANISFKVTTSESVTVQWSSGTYSSSLGCNLTVTGPSPSTNQVGSGSCATATGSVGLGTLASGTYSILIDPQSYNTGGLSLSVTSP
jgi:YD repeat-containing protein